MKYLNKVKAINNDELTEITGGLGAGMWFGAGYHIIKSMWDHKKAYGSGYLDGNGLK